MYKCAVASLSNTGTVETFTVGVAVGITAVITGAIALDIGVLVGVLVYHCITKYLFQNSKPKSSSNPLHQAVPSSNPLQRTGQEYEEIIELGENMAYAPPQSIEMRANEAYCPMQH